MLTQFREMQAENQAIQQSIRKGASGGPHMRLIRIEVQELRAEVLRTDMLIGFAQVERRMNAAFLPLSLYF